MALGRYREYDKFFPDDVIDGDKFELVLLSMPPLCPVFTRPEFVSSL